MAALIGVDLAQAQEIAAEAAQGDVCVAANDNAPGARFERSDAKPVKNVLADGNFGNRIRLVFHQILKNKAKSLGLTLSDDVLNYIAVNVTNNVRQLEGTVKKILAYRDLNNMPLDLPNVSRAIDDMFKSEGNALPTPSLIISQVCKFYSVDENVLRGTLKNKGVAEARQMAMYLIRKLTNLSLPDIGKEFAKDHSTVLYAIRKVEVALKNGGAYRNFTVPSLLTSLKKNRFGSP